MPAVVHDPVHVAAMVELPPLGASDTIVSGTGLPAPSFKVTVMVESVLLSAGTAVGLATTVDRMESTAKSVSVVEAANPLFALVDVTAPVEFTIVQGGQVALFAVTCILTEQLPGTPSTWAGIVPPDKSSVVPFAAVVGLLPPQVLLNTNGDLLVVVPPVSRV